MASAKMASAIGVHINDVGSILKFRIGFPFGGNSAGFCQSVWLPESILNFRIGSVLSIGGVDCRDPVCRHRFRFLDKKKEAAESSRGLLWQTEGKPLPNYKVQVSFPLSPAFSGSRRFQRTVFKLPLSLQTP